MNLLDRLGRLMLVLFTSILIGCEEPNEIGDVLNPGENKIEVLYKELILPASNAFIDSVRTDIDSRILVGNYNDPVFGHTVATGYTEFDFSISSFQPRKSNNNEFIVDSAFVDLIVSYYHSFDTLQTHSFQLHTLTDSLLENVYYLSDFQTPYNTEVVSQDNSLTYKSSVDTVRINLTDNFSKEFLEHLDESVDTRFVLDSADNYKVTDTIYTINQPALRNYFKGLAIVADPNNRSIFGFDFANASTRMELYFRIQDETGSEEPSSFFKMTPLTGTKYYDLQVDRSSTDLTITDNSNSLIDAITSNGSDLFLQSGTGVNPKISFKPYLNFIATLDNVIINKAEIEISTTSANSSFKYLAKPNDIRFFFYSGQRNVNVTGLLNNSIDNTLILTNSSYLGTQPSHFRPSFDEEGNIYSGDATLFAQFVETGNIEVDSLMIIPTDVSSMNRVIFDANSVKMKLFYTIPK